VEIWNREIRNPTNSNKKTQKTSFLSLFIYLEVMRKGLTYVSIIYYKGDVKALGGAGLYALYFKWASSLHFTDSALTP
jgi:hypothetical protein